MGEKSLDFRRPHLCRMTVVVKADVTLYPFGIDSFGTDGIVSDSNLLAQLIQQLGLAVIHVAFLPECCRVCRDNLQARQGLARRQGRLCDRCRVGTRHTCRLINSYTLETHGRTSQPRSPVFWLLSNGNNTWNIFLRHRVAICKSGHFW